MIEEQGVVLDKLPSGRARVKVSHSAACACCASASICRDMTRQGDLEVEADNPIGAQPGQEVILAVPERAVLKATFIIYLIPLAGLLTGAGVSSWLGLKEGQQALGAILGLFVGFGIVRYYNHRLKRADYFPTIARLAV